MDMPPLEELIAGLAGVVTIVILAWNKMNALKTPAIKKAEEDILLHIRGEKDELLRQRDAGMAREAQLKEVNAALDNKMRQLHNEVSSMTSRLIILQELNKRLAHTLDETKARLEQYLAQQEQSKPHP